MPNTLAGQVAFSFPPSWMFKFPPDPEPQSVPPVQNLHSVRAPFGINETLYNAVLQPAVPITFALGYVTCVKIANSFNRKRGNKPWSISKTSAFYYFVILHNVGLAVYSAITCAAMIRALNVSVPSPFGEAGLPGTLDSLCKLHGPRGLGDAVYYDAAVGSWVSKNRLIHLAANNMTPDPTDVGRIWNEGLAFWGWWFYLSKFYEVFDTIIILAKGKRSSTLQTYHHSGAMLCMWAGIRYQGPPIWMFALVNAGIHTIMYTYYTLSAVGIRVPKAVKQLITTAQISQFLVGITFAAAHFFVSYAVPVSVPYTIASAAVGAASSVSSVASAASGLANSKSASSLMAAASGDTVAWLKKFALRAANFEGPAQNVHNAAGTEFGAETSNASKKFEQVQYRLEHEMVHCLDTSGEGFAIWLNVVYLAPLTFLFARFFVKSYLLAPPPKTQRQRRVSDSAMSAARKTSDAIEKFGRSIEDQIGAFGEDAQKASQSIKSSDAKRKVKILVEEAAGSRDAGEAIEDDESETSRADRKTPPGSYAGAVKEHLDEVKEANGSSVGSINQADPLQKPEK